MVSLNVAATSIFFGTCENSACLTSFSKAIKTSCLCQQLNLSRKKSLLRPIDCRNLQHLYQEQIRLDLVSSAFALAWEVTAAPSREKSQPRWGPVTVENRGAAR